MTIIFYEILLWMNTYKTTFSIKWVAIFCYFLSKYFLLHTRNKILIPD